MAPTELDLTAHDGSMLGDSHGAGEVESGASVAGRSPRQLAVARFRKDRGSMIALSIVLFVVVMGILAPFLVKLGVLDPYSLNPDLVDPTNGSLPTGDHGGISADHWLGVEPGTGRDLLSRLILGITYSLFIALTASLLTVIIGVVLGIVSGARGGRVDALIGRVIDMTLSFPQTLMLLALSGGFIVLLVDAGVPAGNPAKGLYVILVLALFGWPVFARLVRGQVLTLREREFIDAARVLGASKRRIYFKEMLPNLWAPILVYFTLTMPAYVSAEAALSYLGVGITAPTPTLGNILTDSANYAESDFVYFFFPALFIAIIVISFNLLGDGLRDALDPKSDQ